MIFRWEIFRLKFFSYLAGSFKKESEIYSSSDSHPLCVQERLIFKIQLH